MSGFEWFLVVLSAMLMLSSLAFRIHEDRAMTLAKCRNRKRVYYVRERRWGD